MTKRIAGLMLIGLFLTSPIGTADLSKENQTIINIGFDIIKMTPAECPTDDIKWGLGELDDSIAKSMKEWEKIDLWEMDKDAEIEGIDCHAMKPLRLKMGEEGVLEHLKKKTKNTHFHRIVSSSIAALEGRENIAEFKTADTTFILWVTPNVEDDKILLDIKYEFKGLVKVIEVEGEDFPVYNERAMDTSFILKNGETLVMGGLFGSGGESSTFNPETGEVTTVKEYCQEIVFIGAELSSEKKQRK